MVLTKRDAERINMTSPAANDIKLGDIVKELQEGGGNGGGETSVDWADIDGKPTEFPPSTHTHTTAQISDASTVGKSVMTAADAAAARTAIGAGSSNLVVGTTASTAAAGNHAHTASQVTATAVAPGTATNVQAILAELSARITALENAGG